MRAWPKITALVLSLSMLNANAEPLPTDEQRGGINKLLRIELARQAAKKKDILTWGMALMPEKFPLDFCKELHEYFVGIRHEHTTSTVAPRGHAKTIIKCCLIPMFQALEEPETYDYYVNVQSTTQKSVAINFSIKQAIEQNELIRAIYGSQMSSAKWTDSQFMLKNGVVFQGVGAGESIRGMQFLNRRPKFIIVDDLYDENDLGHPESVEAKNRWFWGSLYPTRAKGKNTAFHVQGTAIGTNDIMAKLGEMAKTDPTIKHREFAAYNVSTREVLWPELNTIEDLEKERERMGSAIFDREMQGLRRNTADSIIKEHWLENWEYDPAIRWANTARDFGPSTQVRIVGSKLGCDPSTGNKESGDPAGFAVVIETQGPGTRKDYYIEMIAEEVLSFDGRLAKLESMAAQHHARYPDPAFRLRRAYVEAIAGFLDFGNAAKTRTGLPVELITHVKGKISNLAAKSSWFEFGKVHISNAIPKKMRDTLKDQLLINNPPHDDVRDSVLLCLEDTSGPMMKSWV